MRELNNAELINANEVRKFLCFAELINANEPFVYILRNELFNILSFLSYLIDLNEIRITSPFCDLICYH